MNRTIFSCFAISLILLCTGCEKDGKDDAELLIENPTEETRRWLAEFPDYAEDDFTAEIWRRKDPMGFIDRWKERGLEIEEVEESLNKILQSKNVPTRSIYAAGHLRLSKCRSSVLRHIGAEDYRVRLAVVQCLGRIGDKTTLSKLREVLKSDVNHNVRANAIVAIQNLGDANCIEYLNDALEDESDFVSGIAAAAIEKLQDKSKEEASPKGDGNNRR